MRYVPVFAAGVVVGVLIALGVEARDALAHRPPKFGRFAGG